MALQQMKKMFWDYRDFYVSLYTHTYKTKSECCGVDCSNGIMKQKWENVNSCPRLMMVQQGISQTILFTLYVFENFHDTKIKNNKNQHWVCQDLIFLDHFSQEHAILYFKPLLWKNNGLILLSLQQEITHMNYI